MSENRPGGAKLNRDIASRGLGRGTNDGHFGFQPAQNNDELLSEPLSTSFPYVHSRYPQYTMGGGGKIPYATLLPPGTTIAFEID